MPRFFIPTLDFKDRPVLFIDLEMSGLDPQVHEIIEAAALLTRPPTFKIESSYYTKVTPAHISTADPEALSVVGYDSRNWQEAIPVRQMLLDLSNLAPHCILAGWIVQNEWNFLLAALKTEGLAPFFDEKLLEVWSLAYAKFYQNSKIKRLNIVNAARHFGVSVERHKPDSDIRATYEIFRRLVEVD